MTATRTFVVGLALACVLALVGACSVERPRAQASGNPTSALLPARAEAGEEVFYHVFFRSFADSDGDRIGDLKGMTARLDYLKDLGITSLLLTPLQPSPYYHNYFATDFESIEPAYGSMDDYRAFLRAAHARGLKVYLDMEIQYVGEGHPWWTQSLGKPDAPFADFLLWKDKPGGLATILEVIEKAGLNIEYMYAFTFRSGDKAVLVFRFNDADAAIQVLKDNGINVIGGVELYDRAGG